MKTTIMLVLFSFMSISAFNQGENTEQLLASIQGQYQLDENGNITYQKIIDSLNLTRIEIFNKALDYFLLNYADANSAIERKDVDNGIIIGKGLYKKVHGASAVFVYTTIDTWHVLKIEAKDGKARITVSLTQYDEIRTTSDSEDHYPIPISSTYPFVSKGSNKNIYGKAFYKSHLKAVETMASAEKALREGGTKQVKDNW